MTPKREQVQVEEIVSRLSGIRDVVQRGHALAARLKTLDNETVIVVLTTIRERALEGSDVYRGLYSSLLCSGVLSRTMGDVRMSALVEVAQDWGEFGIVPLLMDLPPEMEEDIPFQPFLDPELREVPLGARKELARKPDFKLVERIAKDQDHRVIANLLNNPRLKELDVIRIASSRPTTAKVLEVIYRHPRWVARYRVKKALVMNPHAPLAMALRLLTYMRFQDLEEICDRQDLSPTLLLAAKKALDEKKRKLGGWDDTE